MAETISIAGLDKAEVLAALYNSSRPRGVGHLHYAREPMTVDEARDLLKERDYFDYLKGRVMKVGLDRDDLRVALYDRDNGAGAAEAAIQPLRKASGAP